MNMHVLKKYLVVEYSSSQYQLGDLLTKPLQDKDLWNYTANLYCLCYLCNNFFFFFLLNMTFMTLAIFLYRLFLIIVAQLLHTSPHLQNF